MMVRFGKICITHGLYDLDEPSGISYLFTQTEMEFKMKFSNPMSYYIKLSNAYKYHNKISIFRYVFICHNFIILIPFFIKE